MTVTGSHRGRALRQLAWVFCAVVMPVAAHARCAPFNFMASVSKIPVIVHGKVTSSNRVDVRSAPCSPQVCSHHFDIDVTEVLKGKVAATRLQVRYDYAPQRPEIALFEVGADHVFAISKVGLDGRATLFGTTCGRSGVGADELPAIRQALKRMEDARSSAHQRSQNSRPAN